MAKQTTPKQTRTSTKVPVSKTRTLSTDAKNNFKVTEKKKVVKPTKTDTMMYNSAAKSLNARADKKFETPMLKKKK